MPEKQGKYIKTELSGEMGFVPERLFKKQDGKGFVPEKPPKKPPKPPPDKKK